MKVILNDLYFSTEFDIRFYFIRQCIPPARAVHHDSSIATMMWKRDIFEGDNYHARWTSH